MQSGALGWTANNRLGVKGGPSTTSGGLPDYAPQADLPAAMSLVSEVPRSEVGRPAIHSALIFAALMIGHHFSISAF